MHYPTQASPPLGNIPLLLVRNPRRFFCLFICMSKYIFIHGKRNGRPRILCRNSPKLFRVLSPCCCFSPGDALLPPHAWNMLEVYPGESPSETSTRVILKAKPGPDAGNPGFQTKSSGFIEYSGKSGYSDNPFSFAVVKGYRK